MKALGGGFLLLFLIGFAIYLYLSATTAQKVMHESKPARQVAEEVAGVGMRESFAVDAVEADGKLTGLVVKAIDPAGPLAKMYDLKAGDVITDVGPLSVRDSDFEMLKAQLQEAAAHGHTLKVTRGAKHLELENHGATAQMGGRVPARK